MAKHEITLTDTAEIGYAYALATGEDEMEKKLNLHYEALAPMAEKAVQDAKESETMRIVRAVLDGTPLTVEEKALVFAKVDAVPILEVGKVG